MLALIIILSAQALVTIGSILLFRATAWSRETTERDIMENVSQYYPKDKKTATKHHHLAVEN